MAISTPIWQNEPKSNLQGHQVIISPQICRPPWGIRSTDPSPFGAPAKLSFAASIYVCAGLKVP